MSPVHDRHDVAPTTAHVSLLLTDILDRSLPKHSIATEEG
jgi:hypothetical protein